MNGPTTTPAQTATTRRTHTPPRSPERPKLDTPSGPPILVYLRLHALTIAFTGALVGAGLAYLAWSLTPSKYESYALLQVASTPSSIAGQGDPTRGRTEFVTYLKTTAQLIKSEFVLNAALNDPKYHIGDTQTLKEQKDPIKYLDEKLVVSYSEGSEIIRISLEGDRPDDVRLIVDAVKDAYYREVVEKELRSKTEFKLKVEIAKTKLEDLLKLKLGPPGGTTTPGPFPVTTTNPMGVVDPNLTQAGGVGVIPVSPGTASVTAIAIIDSDAVKRAKFPILVSRVAQLESEIEQYPGALKERQTEIATIKQHLDALQKAPFSAETIAAVEKDLEVVARDAHAEMLRRDHEFLRKSVNNPESTLVVRKKIEAETAEAEAAKFKLEKAKSIEGGKRQAEANRLILQLDAAERGLRTLQEKERVAKKLRDDARKELSETPPPSTKDDIKGPLVDPSKTDLYTLDDMYRRVSAQLVGLDLEMQSPPRVTKRQDASVPAQKDAKKQIIATIGAAFAGFMLVGLGLVGYESRVRKISSLGELRSSGPTPVVGVVPGQPDSATLNDPLKRAAMTEAVDKLRAFVAQNWLSRGAVTVGVTSPLGDEGKAFTAFGLANSLAQTGYKTLLVDFDLRNPSMHAFTGTANVGGVCDLLRSNQDPRGSAAELPNGLHFLPAGTWSEEARMAAVGGRLETLMTRLSEPYDCVIVHGHSLLTAADTAEVSRRCDVVLVCTLYRETRLPLVKRAIDRLTAMEVPHTGVVYLGASENEALC